MKIYNQQTNKILDKDIVEALKALREKRDFKAEKYIKNKIKILNDYMRASKLKACVVGVSGGIDSAVTLGLISKAAAEQNSPIEKIVAALLPVFSKTGATNQDIATSRGAEVCRAFKIKPTTIDLTTAHLNLKNSVDTAFGKNGKPWATGQLVSYLRTPALFYLTSLLNEAGLPAIVGGTTNRDEGAYIGYFGKASDGIVDIQLISDIHKSEVYEVARKLGAPISAIKAVPTGDMFDGRVDEEVFGAPYDFIEFYTYYLTMSPSAKKALMKNWEIKSKKQFKILGSRVEAMHKYNNHKYWVGSPAVHLDIFKSGVPQGWPNHTMPKL